MRERAFQKYRTDALQALAEIGTEESIEILLKDVKNDREALYPVGFALDYALKNADNPADSLVAEAHLRFYTLALEKWGLVLPTWLSSYLRVNDPIDHSKPPDIEHYARIGGSSQLDDLLARAYNKACGYTPTKQELDNCWGGWTGAWFYIARVAPDYAMPSGPYFQKAVSWYLELSPRFYGRAGDKLRKSHEDASKTGTTWQIPRFNIAVPRSHHVDALSDRPETSYGLGLHLYRFAHHLVGGLLRRTLDFARSRIDGLFQAAGEVSNGDEPSSPTEQAASSSSPSEKPRGDKPPRRPPPGPMLMPEDW